jgi:hypothetical protein
MQKREVERRKHKRVFFTMKEGVGISVKIADSAGESISATLLSIGLGGISFAVPRVKANEIKSGDTVIIESIDGLKTLSVIKDLHADVRYVIDYDVYIYISFGCEFRKISDDQRKQIKLLVEERLKKLDNQI